MSTSKAQKQSSKSTKSNPSLADVVKQASSQLDDTAAKLGPEAPQLTATDKRRTVKFRKGAAQVIPAIAALLQSAGVDVTGLSVDQMISDLQRAQTLAPLQTRLQSLSKRVGDEIFTAQTSSLSNAITGYGVLQHMAKKNGDIAAQLEPISSFFAYRNPEKQAAKAPKRVRTAQSKLQKSQARLAAQAAKAQKTLEHIQGSTSAAPAATSPALDAPVVAAPPPAASPPPVASPSAAVADTASAATPKQ